MRDGLATRYAKTADGGAVAYQVLGAGPPDVVYANSFMSHIEASWDYPRAARFYERLASFCRLVLFDRRGTGLSDPLPAGFTAEDRTQDITAVMDAVGLDRAVLMGSSEGATASIHVAARHPERVAALVLFSPWIVARADEECPWAWTPEFQRLFLEGLDEAWSSGAGLEFLNPSLAGDPAAHAWYARYFRLSASPALVRELVGHNGRVDARPLLPAVRAPALLLHRRDETWVSVEQSRYAARHIPGARLVELPGTDHYIWEEDAGAVLDEIEEFLTGVRARAPHRALKCVLFTDIVRSTDHVRAHGDGEWRHLLDRHEATARRQLDRFGGLLVKGTGDGVLATFDQPGQAIRAALAIRDAMRDLGLDTRAGVHAGEVELREGDVVGVAVHVAARVAAAAAAGEVLVSRTVADLVAGSGVPLDDRGEQHLKGFPEPWRLFAARG